jgi:DDE superfamily endonuclease
MDLSTFQQFRHDIYACFRRAKDALFNMADALIAETQAKSFPELSLSPFFERRWHSLYESLEDGQIDQSQLQKVFVKYLPMPCEGKRLIWGIDATSIPRPFSITSPDRTAMPIHNIPHSVPKKSTAITFGWKYSTVTVLPESPSSRTYILAQCRISSDKTDIQVAFEQIQQLVPLSPMRPLILVDRGYDSNWFWCRCSGLPIDALARLKGNRCFYKPAPPPTGKRGAPRKDGAKLKIDDTSTHSNPDEAYDVTDEKFRVVSIRCWKHMHVKDARWLDLTIIQVIRPHAKDVERDPKISWFVYIGQDPPEGFAQIALSYCLRFSHEHGYRFDKQALLWTDPRLRTPEQFDRWSYIVAIAHNHLVLARDLVEAELHPWENKHRDPTPQQVRRGLAKILPQFGTPAPPPRSRGKSKGRTFGTHVRKAERFPVVCKTPKVPQLVST